MFFVLRITFIFFRSHDWAYDRYKDVTVVLLPLGLQMDVETGL